MCLEHRHGRASQAHSYRAALQPLLCRTITRAAPLCNTCCAAPCRAPGAIDMWYTAHCIAIVRQTARRPFRTNRDNSPILSFCLIPSAASFHVHTHARVHTHRHTGVAARLRNYAQTPTYHCRYNDSSGVIITMVQADDAQLTQTPQAAGFVWLGAQPGEMSIPAGKPA